MSNKPEIETRIYLLPNLMTAGNLFCGFSAILFIFQGMTNEDNGTLFYQRSILLIFGSFIFDMLDGRLARLGSKESAFGREFDSLADIVSFGVAPALLVYSVVLKEFSDVIGILFAFLYLLCGALRLARFNCLDIINSTLKTETKKDKESGMFFTGFPIPAAAGVIVSLTHTLLWAWEGEKNLGMWKYLLPIIMVMVSVVMMSKLQYPSFKNISWKTKNSMIGLVISVIILILIVTHHEIMPTLVFVTYLFYGFFRPMVPKKIRSEIELEEENND